MMTQEQLDAIAVKLANRRNGLCMAGDDPERDIAALLAEVKRVRSELGDARDVLSRHESCQGYCSSCSGLTAHKPDCAWIAAMGLTHPASDEAEAQGAGE